jgi:arginase
VSISRRIAIIGVPTNSSGLPNGVARAPTALRRAGLLQALDDLGTVRDDGDVLFEPPTSDRDSASGMIAPQTLVSMVLGVRVAVRRALGDGYFPLVIGGDCPLLLGCLAAVRTLHNRVGLLFVDGHEDAYPPHASLTGETADMELGLALGRSLTTVPGEVRLLLPLIRPRDVVLLGPRDAALLNAEGVRSVAGDVCVVNDLALRNGDIRALTNKALRDIHAHEQPWWLHTDLDVLATEALPAVDYRQSGGLLWYQLEDLTATAVATPNLLGWNVTIYNPDLDRAGHDASRIVAYIVAQLKRLTNE